MSLSQSLAARTACLSFLFGARAIALRWVYDLREKAYAAVDTDDRTSFIAKSVEVALICMSTCDLDQQFIPELLAGDNNTSTLIQCSIIIQEGKHSKSDTREESLALLDTRYKRLLQCAHRIMAQHPSQVDHAVRNLWSDYVPGHTGWTLLPAAGNHWLSTDTVLAQGSSMSVHYDLLSGQLLVNGLLMDQPPNSCRDHPLYLTLFDRAIVEVMPCTAPGLQFSAMREFGGHTVRLGISQSELLVEATKDSITYKTLPRHLFEETFPYHFAHDFVHWFNIATRTVQFRPVG